MSKCERCGRCCYYFDGLWKPCRYLMRFETGFTFCRIYPNRLGTEIDQCFKCVEESPWNIAGCPYNSPEKKPHPHWG